MRPPQSERHPRRLFASIANKALQAAGRALTFVLACAEVVIWAITGPVVPILRYLAACHQYGDDHRHLSNGLPDTELAEPG
jgi:hypothetical protein